MWSAVTLPAAGFRWRAPKGRISSAVGAAMPGRSYPLRDEDEFRIVATEPEHYCNPVVDEAQLPPELGHFAS
jgi:hypothetical protein